MTHLTPSLTPDAKPHSGPSRSELAELAALIERYAPYQGRHTLRHSGVHAIRFNAPTSLVHGMYKPSVCFVAQGAKRVFLGTEVFDYNEQKLLLSSLELPVTAQVIQASYSQPFLSVTLDLNAQRVAELAQRVFVGGVPDLKDNRGVGVGDVTSELICAVTRLLRLMPDDRDLELLAPMVTDEIVIRLLRGPLGARLAQMGREESSVQRVSRAIDWIRQHFDQPINVELLAELVYMSPSSFHGHFKAVTNMSPLQFQKGLRLREARRLMLSAQLDVTTAGRQVGYVSSSQFIREYGRLFGNAPARDVALLRQQGEVSPSSANSILN